METTHHKLAEQFNSGKHRLVWGENGEWPYASEIAYRAAWEVECALAGGTRPQMLRFYAMGQNPRGEPTRRKYQLDFTRAEQTRLSPCDSECPASHHSQPQPHIRPISFAAFEPADEAAYAQFRENMLEQRRAAMAEHERRDGWVAIHAGERFAFVDMAHQPAELGPRNNSVMEENPPTCIVCAEDLAGAGRRVCCYSPCWHSVCETCMIQIMAMPHGKSCPLCRAPIREADIRMNTPLMAMLQTKYGGENN